MIHFDAARARMLLRRGTGNASAEFRAGQEEAIRHVVERRGRLLVVQKTGWGKSFVYFIAAKLLREAGEGPAILISPLLALMRNQILAAQRMGVNACVINSENQEKWTEVESRLESDLVDILLISPERLANEHFKIDVLAGIAHRVSLLVVDEAHCISDWGHDFRPHYRLLERVITILPRRMRLLATTATANNRVMQDLVSVLGPDLNVLRGELSRNSLTLQTLRLPGQVDRLAWLAGQLGSLPGSGIIYTLTVRDAEQVAAWLKRNGFNVQAYTGKSGPEREDLESALLGNRVKALVATTALGMGFDKPDLAFVIHYQTPGSVVAYYQQVGRAGRALKAAYGILLSGFEEVEITNYFIRSAFPNRQEVNEVLHALEEEPQGLSVPQLMGRVNLGKGRVEKAITLLSLESPAPLVRQGSKWQLTAATLSESFWERADRLTVLRRQEQQEMQEFVRLPFGKHMAFLIQALDGDPTELKAPALPPLSENVRPDLMRDAATFLRRTSFPVEARKSWPAGGLPYFQVKGRIAQDEQAMQGRALCSWGDGGWGALVRQGKYRDGQFSDELVAACQELVQTWRPYPEPAWVTCIPSLRHPKLVPGFARRLAKRLNIPFVEVLMKTEDRPEQKMMANSVQQARNIDGALRVEQSRIQDGPVLLVDDMVDSRWTFTVAAWLLRRNGCGPVWPLALADTGGGR